MQVIKNNEIISRHIKRFTQTINNKNNPQWVVFISDF